jgi:23S rRNA pseudouridine1911/1915/1917 synthase
MRGAKSHVVGRASAARTVEEFLVKELGMGPRAALKKAFLEGRVLVNERAARRTEPVGAGDHVEVRGTDVFSRGGLALPNPAIPLEVAAETSGLVVVAKPAGLSTHPLRPTETDTVLNAVVARYHEIAAVAADSSRPLEGGLVHRLDRGTSGLLVSARTPEALHLLREAWHERKIEKVYLAWLDGCLERGGRLELCLAHDPKSKARMTAYEEHPKKTRSWLAVTEISPLVNAPRATLALIRIHTGVMHQIRASCAWLGHPVIGDAIYGTKGAKIRGGRIHEPLSTATRELFERLARAANLPADAAPRPDLLPKDAFFLHALWLRANIKGKGFEPLANGLLAPVPGYFL